MDTLQVTDEFGDTVTFRRTPRGGVEIVSQGPRGGIKNVNHISPDQRLALIALLTADITFN
ncbi:hypothetical protein SEA_TROOPER_91 [Mycobacterium phage Trooper]|nr:hypothetical protein SEA_TROOPER_91 [Mycobacterium phage Trooper]